jgi:aspartyl-tRNA(Asn)/glutamyl-tRNA(Gln) amidotransferase subunit A
MKAPDYIRAWRELELIRRTVDQEVFEKQNVDVLIAPAARHLPPTIEEELAPNAGGGATGGRGGATAAAGDAPASGARAGGRGGANARAQIDPQENTRPFNAYGLPVVTLPCGFSKDGLPIGLQIAGPRFGEAAVLSLAHAYEQATEWHKRRPELTPETKVPALSKAASEQTGG